MHPILIGIARIVEIASDICMWIIILRAITSWITINPYNRMVIFSQRMTPKQKIKRFLLVGYTKLVIFLYRVTEPVFRPVRKLIPRHSLPIDFAPLIVLLVLMILQYIILQILFLTARVL